MIVGAKSTIWDTVNVPPKQRSKLMQKHSGRRNKENLGTNPLMEEDKKKVVVEDESFSIMMGIPTEE